MDKPSTKVAREEAPARDGEKARGGPHYANPGVPGRFPTEAGGHPVPDVGEQPGHGLVEHAEKDTVHSDDPSPGAAGSAGPAGRPSGGTAPGKQGTGGT